MLPVRLPRQTRDGIAVTHLQLPTALLHRVTGASEGKEQLLQLVQGCTLHVL